MRLIDESVIEGGHLTPEERIALQAEEIKQLQQENEQLKDENASLRNWNACEEKLHNELLESDKRRWELESELEDANNYREGLEAIVDKLRAQVARMRKAIQKYILSIEKQYSIEDHHKCPICGIFTKTEYCHLCVTKELINAMSDTVQDYHNPADVEALRKAREAIRAAWSDGSANAAMDKASEALTAIDKAIGGGDVDKG